MNPPLVSVEAADWLVYADWAQDFPNEAIWSEDKARRIAFVLKNWYVYWNDVEQAHRHPNLWMRLDRWLKRGGEYVWRWDTKPTQAPLTPINQDHRPEMDEFTNPAESHLCMGNQWHAVKFFNFILLPKTLEWILRADERQEYRRLFDRVGERTSLRHLVVVNGAGKYRRVHWVRGEYLEVTDLEETSRGIEGQACLIEPCAPYPSYTPDAYRSDRPWPLLMRNNAIGIGYGTMGECDARGGIHDKKKVRWRAHDWVKL